MSNQSLIKSLPVTIGSTNYTIITTNKNSFETSFSATNKSLLAL
jgi:hypothetical protein